MEEHTLSEWIDQYLLGTISPEDRKRLEALMHSDPAVAELVKDSKQAYKALVHARHQQLRGKLRELDKEDPRQSGFAPRWFGWFSILLLLVMVYIYFACIHFNPASVAMRYFNNLSNTESALVSSPELQASWEKAKTAFLAKDYQQAIALYEPLTSVESENNAFARWNLLLAQLALEGPSSNWKAGMDIFAMEAPEPLSSQAHQLASLFDSTFYRLFCAKLRENLSAMKPKLI